MAKGSIAQTFGDVNTKNSTSVRGQYLIGFSMADYDQTRYDMSGQLRCEVEKVILSRTNEQAFSILGTVDVIDHIPGAGENFIPLNGFANYYGVSEEYLKGVLNRRRYLQKNYPEDIKRVYATDIIRNPGVPLLKDNYLKVPGRDDLLRCRLSDSYGPPCVSFPKNKSFLIYSPRIVLATALSLLYTDKSGENNTAKKVTLAIKRSDYRVVEEEPEEPDDGIIPYDGLTVNPNGGVTLSRELLDYIIRKTTSEAIGKLVKSIAEMEEPSTTLPPAQSKNEKPEGWDDIVAKWKYGKLTTHKAAKMVGLSVTGFKDYASGKKTFD